jgi:hypothetical protein
MTSIRHFGFNESGFLLISIIVFISKKINTNLIRHIVIVANEITIDLCSSQLSLFTINHLVFISELNQYDF